jgi:hypothetical protein
VSECQYAASCRQSATHSPASFDSFVPLLGLASSVDNHFSVALPSLLSYCPDSMSSQPPPARNHRGGGAGGNGGGHRFRGPRNHHAANTTPTPAPGPVAAAAPPTLPPCPWLHAAPTLGVFSSLALARADPDGAALVPAAALVAFSPAASAAAAAASAAAAAGGPVSAPAVSIHVPHPRATRLVLRGLPPHTTLAALELLLAGSLTLHRDSGGRARPTPPAAAPRRRPRLCHRHDGSGTRG